MIKSLDVKLVSHGIEINAKLCSNARDIDFVETFYKDDSVI